jgi:hypothetical protein
VEAEEAEAPAAEQAGARVMEWEVYREQAGGKRSARSNTTAAGVGPIEQLRLTGGYTTDYLWYGTTIAVAERYEVQARGAGILYSYVDGVLLPSTSGGGGMMMAADASAAALPPESEGGHYTYEAAGWAPPSPAAATAELQILSVAMGMSNGGSIANVKGITGNVTVNGAVVTRAAPWSHRCAHQRFARSIV